MKKNIMGIFGAALAAGVMLLAGCGGKGGTSGAAAAQTGGAVEKQAITGALLTKLGLEKGSNGLYRFKETKAITVEIFDRGLDGGKSKPEDNFYTNWIKEGMLRDHNVAVTFVPVGRWTEIDELNNLLAAGSAPDVCVTYNYPTIQAYANMGGVTDINPYINGYADLFPNIWDWLGAEFINYDRNPKTQETWALEARLSNQAGRNVFVRKDWLQKLNLKEPKTIDEFHDMLVAFRDNAQTLLGKDAGMMVPFIMGQDVAWQTQLLIESFIPDNVTDRDWFVYGFDVRHTDRPGIIQGETVVKSATRILNKWYNENLIWKDFALYGSGDTTQDNLTKSGYVGAFMQNWDLPYRDGKNSFSAALHTIVGPDADFIAIEAFPNNAGSYARPSGPLVDRKVFFPASNKEPVASLFYLDWLHQKDHLFFMQFGEAGVTHQVEANGAVRAIATTGEKIINSPNNIDYTILINGIKMPTADLTVKSMALAYAEVDPVLVQKAYEASSKKRFIPHANVGAVESEEGMSQVLEKKRDAIFAKTIPAAPGQFDAIYDAGYQDYLASGAQAIIDERAAKWKEFYGDRTSVNE